MDMIRRSANLFLLAAAFAIGAAWPVDAAQRSSGKVDAFVHEGLPFFASRVAPKTFRAMKDFERETVIQEQDPIEASQRNANHVFELKGLWVWLLCAPATSTECMLVHVVLSEPRRSTKFGLSVGSSADQLQRLLGYPNSRQGNEWVYDAESSSVSFVLHSGRIKEIRWLMYVG